MNTFKSVLAGCFIAAATLSAPVLASDTAAALGSCLGDHTTGKDRKDLAQWVFAAMAAHPEIKPLSNVTEANREEMDRSMAALATRLLTENCRTEAKAAISTGGSAAIEAAFEVLGQLAMQEIMSDASVNASITRYGKYLDNAKFEAAFK